ncbi:MAG: HDIG domain-containing protein [Desulfarculus sp.]|nr:HDIG domain-containing protein [Desulfarculus sp.]
MRGMEPDMPQQDPPKLKAVPPRTQRFSWPRVTGRLPQVLERLKALAGGGRGAQWLLAGLVGLVLAVAVTPHPWRLDSLPQVLGGAALAAALLRVLFVAWYQGLARAGGRAGARNLGLSLALVVMAAFLGRGWAMFAAALLEGWSGLGLGALAFAAPLSAGPILGTLLLGPQMGMLVALAGGLVGALAWPQPAGPMVYFLVSGVAAAHYAGREHSLPGLIKAGFRGALAGLPVVLGLALWQGWLMSTDALCAVLAVGLGGALGGVLAAGLAPLVEMILGYTTHIRLMELSSLDQPALQELMLQAPGTYHHSLVVGSLVEAAAQEIGADSLLAKVAALYHDLGKIKKSPYFVENQASGPNRHEKLAPSMSALILTSHVKEGVEMAGRHRLGKPIIDIIAQHHGTRLIPFFYSKACEARRALGQPDPDPEDYRYPGPRPQTREAGLVMLADTVEAASRSLDNPTPAHLQGLVQQQISKIFAEGQLDDCELTLKDLHKIAKIFNTILSGIFHQRVEYPQADDKPRKRHGDSDKQPPGKPANKPQGPGGQGEAGLRRLGLR